MQTCSSGCTKKEEGGKTRRMKGIVHAVTEEGAEIRRVDGSESDVSDRSDMSSSSLLSKQHDARSLVEASPAELLHALRY